MYKSTSKIILGTVQFGLDYGINNFKGKVSKREVFEIFAKAAFEGIDVLDTADEYGNASRLIGEFIKSTGYKFIVNTKFKFNSKRGVEQQLQYSLELLKTDKINVYFFHNFNDLDSYPEIIDQLQNLKKEGMIDKIGVSIYGNDQFEKAISIQEIDVIQTPFNLLDNYLQRGALITKGKELGKEIQVRSIFLQGLFFRDQHTYSDQLAPLKPYIDILRQIMIDSGKSMEELALIYTLAHNDIDNVIIGVDSKEQFSKNLSHLSGQLDRPFIDRINNIEVKETELLYPNNWR